MFEVILLLLLAGAGALVYVAFVMPGIEARLRKQQASRAHHPTASNVTELPKRRPLP